MTPRIHQTILLGLFLIGIMIAPTLAQTGEFDCDRVPDEQDTIPYLMGEADAYLTQGRQAIATAILTCVIELDPDYTAAYIRRGATYGAQGDPEAALADYDTAIERNPDAVQAYINRGVVYTQQGRFGLALSDFDLAASIQPDNPVIYVNRAVVNAIEGEYDLALDDLEQATDLDPEYAPAYAARGTVYSALALEQYSIRDDLTDDMPMIAGLPDDIMQALMQEQQSATFGTWLTLQASE